MPPFGLKLSENTFRMIPDISFFDVTKVSTFFFSKTLSGRLHPKDCCDRPEIWPKRISDDPRHFIFRRRKKISAKKFEKTGGGVQQPEEWSATTCGFARVSGLRWEGVGEGKHKLSHTRPQGVGGFSAQYVI